MMQDGRTGENGLILPQNLNDDIINYISGSDAFSRYVADNYDSSADYWKLTREGNLEFDGHATLFDEDGNIIKSYKAMGLKNDNQVEGSLIYLLGIDKSDKRAVQAVRQMMAQYLDHSVKTMAGMSPLLSIMSMRDAANMTDSEEWYWVGEIDSDQRQSPVYLPGVNLSEVNMGKQISLGAIQNLYANIGADKNVVNNFITNVFGSAVTFMNYTDASNQQVATKMLEKVYTPTEMGYLRANQVWYNTAIQSGIDYSSMVPGFVKTMGFDVESGELKVDPEKNDYGADRFFELHPSIDGVGNGESLKTPYGSIWQAKDGNDGQSKSAQIFSLFGTDMMMRINHLDRSDVIKAIRNTIYGAPDSTVDLINYPKANNGTSTDIHVDIQITRILPTNGQYMPRFVNPETLLPGNNLDYWLLYKTSSGELLHEGSYNRYYGR